jgi:anthranilate synthase component 1
MSSAAGDLTAPEPATVPAVARHEPAAYAALIERCRDAIREGDAYQLCLTTRFTVVGPVDPIAAYARLRARTPAHHGGIIRSGGVALVSASPERFLEVSGGVARTRPIKGTRPRGADAESDAALAAELRASEKERAENIMIVDLMRNDLSRVCEPGSVGVDGLLEVESYPAVHQLVSTVSGRLAEDVTVGDLLDATFPAGSMTGAPKLSAMTILHELERGPRGVFAGCFGWVGEDGALDLAMVIRSIVVHPGGAYVGAGGGITWRSDAAAEVAEVGIKARGPLAAIGADLPLGW